MRAPSLRRLAPLALLGFVALSPGARAEDPAPRTPGHLEARVSVVGDGFVRVKAAALRGLGFSDQDELKVTRGDRPVPQLTARVGDDVVFLALGTQRAHSALAVYRLVAGRPDLVPGSTLTAEEVKGLELPRDQARVHRADDRPHLLGDRAAAEEQVYAPAAPTWFREKIAPRGTLELRLPPESLEGLPQRLTLRVLATQPGEIALAAFQGTRELGVQRLPFAPEGGELSWELEGLDPAVPLLLRDASLSVPAPPRDVSDARGQILVQGWAWEGAIDVARATGLCSLEATPRLLVVRGLPRPGWRLLAVNAAGELLGPPSLATPTAGAPLAGIPAGASVIACPTAPTGARVYLGPERGVLPVAAPGPMAPRPALDGVEHLIVAVPALVPGARRLARHRTAHGLRSVALSSADLDERFGHGERDPQVLRRFLRELRASPQGSLLRYVLLVGDATFDRSDIGEAETLPALMARTQYNGATPADTLYVEGDGDPETQPPVVGRLPFGDAATLEAFVSRLIAYETTPPRDDSRRMLRFLASEGRFGRQADALIETFFKRIVGRNVAPAYDAEVTFASPTSVFLWPPREFNAKVIEGINAGALFYTYVGHGFAQGFDDLRAGQERFPILHLNDAGRIEVRGTPPVVVAVACTTAQFDHPRAPGLGETLLARPRGPIAYLGATRICHPAANAFLGRSIARAMFPPGGGSGAGGVRRLGEVLAAARREVLDPRHDDKLELQLLTLGTLSMLPPGTSLTRLKHEAFWLYNLLGDPGTRLALPETALEVLSQRAGESVKVEVRGAEEGTTVAITIELPRERQHPFLPVTRRLNAGDVAQAEAIRQNHRHANDKVVLRGEAPTKDGVARLTLTPAPDTHSLGHVAYGGAFQVKAATQGPGPVGLGAALLLWDGVSSPDGVGSPDGATEAPK